MTEYFNLIKPIDYSIVKTLILTGLEQCLNYNKIDPIKTSNITTCSISK